MEMINYFKTIKFTFGIPSLWPEWKEFFSRKFLLDDTVAGITVALIAIPLSLAIALASDVPPATGLVTAIVAGLMCAFFGGTTLAVSGPAAAMAVLIANNVEKFGLPGLVIIGLLAGMMQLISGICGIGKLARYVPIPVIAGFTAGIGVIIIIGQLPRAFGLLPPPESHIFDVIKEITVYIKDINITCLLLVILTFGIIRGLPRLLPNFSPILPAVAVTTAITYFFHLKNIPIIGSIPQSLPAPHLNLFWYMPLHALLLNAFTIFLLASLETLLSSSAIDKISNSKKHNPDQELIGQGLGNIAAALFNGMPATGVIARSIANVKAGAKTRRSSIFHAILILAAIYGLAPVIAHIPIAALAGVLFSVAFSMVDYREFYSLWQIARSEAIIYAITFFTIIFVDLIAGVQVGIMAAGLIILLKAAKTQMYISNSSRDNTLRFSLSGSFTFLSIGKVVELEQRIENAKSGQTVILDLSNIDNMDSSGASAVVDLSKYCQTRDIKFYIKGLASRFEAFFHAPEAKYLIDHQYLISESELKNKELGAFISARDRLIHGAKLFHAERERNDKRLFHFLESQQDPHTLFITCSDSRIVPSVMTSADPGELFVVRNVGNFIPPYQKSGLYSEVAALEFALNYLNISDIVVCGHANCGAIRACNLKNSAPLPPKLQSWIDMIKNQLDIHESKELDDLARDNVLNQIDNLQQYPIIQKKLEEKILKIHAWFFNFEQNMVYEWHPVKKIFKSIIPS